MQKLSPSIKFAEIRAREARTRCYLIDDASKILLFRIINRERWGSRSRNVRMFLLVRGRKAQEEEKIVGPDGLIE